MEEQLEFCWDPLTRLTKWRENYSGMWSCALQGLTGTNGQGCYAPGHWGVFTIHFCSVNLSTYYKLNYWYDGSDAVKSIEKRFPTLEEAKFAALKLLHEKPPVNYIKLRH